MVNLIATNLSLQGGGQYKLHLLSVVIIIVTTLEKFTVYALLNWRSEKIRFITEFLLAEWVLNEFSQICYLPLPWTVIICT